MKYLNINNLKNLKRIFEFYLKKMRKIKYYIKLYII